MTNTQKIGTREITDQIARIDDQLIDLLAEAEARSFGAVSGNADDIEALAGNSRQRTELEAQRNILEQAKAQAARNEAADAAAADAERVKQHERSIRQIAAKLRTRAVRVEAMRDEFATIFAEMVELEQDIRIHCNRIGENFQGRTGQGELAANAVARMGNVNLPEYKHGRSLTDLTDVAWGPFLTGGAE